MVLVLVEREEEHFEDLRRWSFDHRCPRRLSSSPIHWRAKRRFFPDCSTKRATDLAIVAMETWAGRFLDGRLRRTFVDVALWSIGSGSLQSTETYCWEQGIRTKNNVITALLDCQYVWRSGEERVHRYWFVLDSIYPAIPRARRAMRSNDHGLTNLL